MPRPRTPSASLEREVIFSVVVLYILICAVMLAIHYLQPAGAAKTSSTSPFHAEPEHPAHPAATTATTATGGGAW